LSCSFGPGSAQLTTSGGDGTVIIWDLAQDSSGTILAGHTGWVRACAVAPDGSWLVSGGDDGTTRVWEASHGQRRLVLEPGGNGGRVRHCSVAPDGSWIASSGDSGTVSIWDPATGALIAELAEDCAVLACPVSYDGKFLATITNSKQISVWDFALKARVATMRVEQPLRGGIWLPHSYGLCVIGESGVYRYDLIVSPVETSSPDPALGGGGG
jgi:WD40 repeat protein